ncbi:MAG: bifunctional phosphoribosyl-AMP cyclohydrolase/phosphoribosyl-ATP diphosphatase HisIE [Alicyclobacillaceae bacterium]|nr:bifunctional phosphoribosyl-AMP cyclohydrolase/phosphoribosyl-ATP diphosphatase HisIE [Alicyclobacillaceae bacterium]
MAEPFAAALEAVRYDARSGLVPVVVQDVRTGEVLMLAYANREALKRTLDTGQAWFWSRSRQDYWRKGATSGHVMRVAEVRLDCDGDAVLYLVEPAGPACHTGEVSCFHRRLVRTLHSDPADRGDPAETDNPGDPGATGDPEPEESTDAGDASRLEQPSQEAAWDVLDALWQVIERRWRDRPEGSYTTYLFTQGVDKAAKKVGEEAVEVALAAKNAVAHAQAWRPAGESPAAAGHRELAQESADLLYHLLVLWRLAGVHPADVAQVLHSRAR